MQKGKPARINALHNARRSIGTPSIAFSIVTGRSKFEEAGDEFDV
jgi:hypothetical protein